MYIDQKFISYISGTRQRNTVRSYITKLNDFFDFILTNGYQIIDTSIVQEYINYISKKNIPSSVRVKYNIIKLYLDYKNIKISKVQLPKVQQVEQKYLDDNLLNSYLIEVNRINKSIKLKVLLFILPFTGLRISEVFSLTKQSIIKRNNKYLIQIEWMDAKNKKSRVIPLNNMVKAILLPYLKQTEDFRLFIISRSAVTKKLKQIGKKIGAPWLHPHSLRHTFASRLALNGVDIKTIQKLMGHSDPSTTLSYTHSNINVMQDAVEKI